MRFLVFFVPDSARGVVIVAEPARPLDVIFKQ